MDGTLAVLTLIFGLWDMTANYCETGCLARSEVQGYTAVSGGPVFSNNDRIANEIYIRRDTRRKFGPFQMTYGLSVTDQSAVWMGAGPTYTVPLKSDTIFVELHTMAGLFLKGDGPGLGGPIEFRSGIEIGYEVGNGTRFGLSYDHRSNAGIYADNPGIESFQLRLAMPF
jgi:lipid A 3-O-deacylase